MKTRMLGPAVLDAIFAMFASSCSAGLVMSFVVVVASTLLGSLAVRVSGASLLAPLLLFGRFVSLDCLVLCSAASPTVSPRFGARVNISTLEYSSTPLSTTAASATNSLVHV